MSQVVIYFWPTPVFLKLFHENISNSRDNVDHVEEGNFRECSRKQLLHLSRSTLEKFLGGLFSCKKSYEGLAFFSIYFCLSIKKMLLVTCQWAKMVLWEHFLHLSGASYRVTCALGWKVACRLFDLLCPQSLSVYLTSLLNTQPNTFQKCHIATKLHILVNCFLLDSKPSKNDHSNLISNIKLLSNKLKYFS